MNGITIDTVTETVAETDTGGENDDRDDSNFDRHRCQTEKHNFDT